MDYLSNEYQGFEGPDNAFKSGEPVVTPRAAEPAMFELPSVTTRGMSGIGSSSKSGYDGANSIDHTSNGDCRRLSREHSCGGLLLSDNICASINLINSLKGKDRIAKVLEYLLKLLRGYVVRSIVYIQGRNYLSLENDKLLKWRTVKTLIHLIPRVYLKLLGSPERIDKQLEYISSQLETYRYFLRSGNSPFLLYKLIKRLGVTFKSLGKNRELGATTGMRKIWLTESSLTDVVGLYFSVFDGLLLFNRLKIWSDKRLCSVASRHRNLAWESRILFDIFHTWEQLNQLQGKETELRVQLLVRERAMRYYRASTFNSQRDAEMSPIRKQLLRDLRKGDGSSREGRNVETQLEEIRKLKIICRLDLLRLLLDLGANSKNVFDLNLSSGTYNLLLVCSGVIELIKLWLNGKTLQTAPLEEQELFLGL